MYFALTAILKLTQILHNIAGYVTLQKRMLVNNHYDFRMRMSLHVPEENKKVSASGEAPLPLEIGTAEARADIDRYGSWEASHQNCVLAMSKNKSTYLEELGA